VPSQFATVVAPSDLSWLGIGREAYAGTPVLPADVVPVDGDAYEPEDTPTFLHDRGVRAAMGGEFGAVPGPQAATFTFGGPLFLDSWGYFLDNLFGDLSAVTSGTSTIGTPRALENALPIGATSLNVNASLGLIGAGNLVQIADGAASEIVLATAVAGGTAVSFTGTPCRFAHNTNATAAVVLSANSYAHTFAVLNNGTGQGPTHTLTDWTGLTTTVGARAYPSAVVAQLDLTGDSTGLVMSKVSGASWLSAPSASAPSAPGGYAPPLASWRSTVTLGGTQIPDVGQWAVSFKRQLMIYWGAGNAQTPYVIARGPLTITGGLDYTVPSDESPLTLMTSGAQPALAISVSNGLTGASALSMTITGSQTQAVTAKPIRGETLVGYQDTWVAIDNPTDVGGTGLLGPGTVVIVNSVATY
jgi:hypothetical protein